MERALTGAAEGAHTRLQPEACERCSARTVRGLHVHACSAHNRRAQVDYARCIGSGHRAARAVSFRQEGRGWHVWCALLPVCSSRVGRRRSGVTRPCMCTAREEGHEHRVRVRRRHGHANSVAVQLRIHPSVPSGAVHSQKQVGIYQEHEFSVGRGGVGAEVQKPVPARHSHLPFITYQPGGA